MKERCNRDLDKVRPHYQVVDSLPVTPETCANELDDREIVGSVLVISRGDAPELLDPIEEPLDEIMLTIEP